MSIILALQADALPEIPSSSGISRNLAFKSDGFLVVRARSEPGTTSGWHHHGDHDVYGYVASGSARFGNGPGGRNVVSLETGDFFCVPSHTVSHMWELFAMSAWFLLFFADALRVRGLSVGSIAAFVTYSIFLAGGLGSWLGGVMADRWGRTSITILMMAISGGCAILIGLFFGSSSWLILAVGLVWGFTSVADSAQFSTMVTELGDQAYIGTALTLQLAAGFAITVATIWLIPILEAVLGWRWAFAFLAPGPVLGILAM